jgi:regulator of cell morphogenesis and NO signaling
MRHRTPLFRILPRVKDKKVFYYWRLRHILRNENSFMEITQEDTVGLIVARNIHAASVFNSYGIDFFSRGDRTVEAACLEDHVPMPTLLEDLWELRNQNFSTPDFYTMDLTTLSIYILKTHHRFTEKRVIFIKHTLERLIREFGEQNRKVNALKDMFDDLSVYLTVHMKHEEHIVFPFIQKLAKTRAARTLSLSSIEQPIAAMKDDHDHEVLTLKSIASLTDHYAVGKNSDYGLKITYGAMRELEDDLRIHMHLENNILFPRAIDLAYSNIKNLN